MDTNISIKKPSWLTDNAIERYKKMIADCKNPITEEEYQHYDYIFDGGIDTRLEAYKARKILEKYGII